MFWFWFFFNFRFSFQNYYLFSSKFLIFSSKFLIFFFNFLILFSKWLSFEIFLIFYSKLLIFLFKIFDLFFFEIFYFFFQISISNFDQFFRKKYFYPRYSRTYEYNFWFHFGVNSQTTFYWWSFNWNDFNNNCAILLLDSNAKNFRFG